MLIVNISVFPQRNGYGTYKSKMTGVYSGWWENDLQNGKGNLVYPNGDVYDGNWMQNKVSLYTVSLEQRMI